MAFISRHWWRGRWIKPTRLYRRVQKDSRTRLQADCRQKTCHKRCMRLLLTIAKTLHSLFLLFDLLRTSLHDLWTGQLSTSCHPLEPLAKFGVKPEGCLCTKQWLKFGGLCLTCSFHQADRKQHLLCWLASLLTALPWLLHYIDKPSKMLLPCTENTFMFTWKVLQVSRITCQVINFKCCICKVHNRRKYCGGKVNCKELLQLYWQYKKLFQLWSCMGMFFLWHTRNL